MAFQLVLTQARQPGAGDAGHMPPLLKKIVDHLGSPDDSSPSVEVATYAQLYPELRHRTRGRSQAESDAVGPLHDGGARPSAMSRRRALALVPQGRMSMVYWHILVSMGQWAQSHQETRAGASV